MSKEATMPADPTIAGLAARRAGLLDHEIDAAIEAGMEAGRIDRLPEYDDQIAEAVGRGVRVAVDVVAALPHVSFRAAVSSSTPEAGQPTEAGVDPVVAAVDLLFEHRHTLPPDVLRSMAGIWVCASAARYGEPHEPFWEDVSFADHDTDECEAQNAGQARAVAEAPEPSKLAEMATVIDEVIAHHRKYDELDEQWLGETARRLRLMAAAPAAGREDES